MDTEIAAIIAELEKENQEEILIEEPVAEEPIEEIIEDDVLVEDKPEPALPIYKVGDTVKLLSDARYINNTSIPNSIKNSKLYIRNVNINDTYSISTKMSGRTAGAVHAKYIIPYTEKLTPAEDTSNHYLILVKVKDLNIKSRPDASSKTLKTIHFNGLYTVIEEKNNWGHLKIGGWIPLSDVRKLSI